MPEMDNKEYQKRLKEHQEKLSSDPVYGCLVLEEYGSYLGEAELKLDESFEEFLKREPHYQNLMTQGCILVFGPNVKIWLERQVSIVSIMKKCTKKEF